jgi:hypothetical protein
MGIGLDFDGVVAIADADVKVVRPRVVVAEIVDVDGIVSIANVDRPSLGAGDRDPVGSVIAGCGNPGVDEAGYVKIDRVEFAELDVLYGVPWRVQREVFRGRFRCSPAIYSYQPLFLGRSGHPKSGCAEGNWIWVVWPSPSAGRSYLVQPDMPTQRASQAWHVTCPGAAAVSPKRIVVMSNPQIESFTECRSCGEMNVCGANWR